MDSCCFFLVATTFWATGGWGDKRTDVRLVSERGEWAGTAAVPAARCSRRDGIPDFGLGAWAPERMRRVLSPWLPPSACTPAQHGRAGKLWPTGDSGGRAAESTNLPRESCPWPISSLCLCPSCCLKNTRVLAVPLQPPRGQKPHGWDTTQEDEPPAQQPCTEALNAKQKNTHLSLFQLF